MRHVITLALIAAFLAACSSPEVWHRPGANQQDASADASACQTSAQRNGYGGAGVYDRVGAYNYVHRCMAARGYSASIY